MCVPWLSNLCKHDGMTAFEAETAMLALPGNSMSAGQDRTMSFATVQTDEGGPAQNVRPLVSILCKHGPMTAI